MDPLAWVIASLAVAAVTAVFGALRWSQARRRFRQFVAARPDEDPREALLKAVQVDADAAAELLKSAASQRQQAAQFCANATGVLVAGLLSKPLVDIGKGAYQASKYLVEQSLYRHLAEQPSMFHSISEHVKNWDAFLRPFTDAGHALGNLDIKLMASEHFVETLNTGLPVGILVFEGVSAARAIARGEQISQVLQTRGVTATVRVVGWKLGALAGAKAGLMVDASTGGLTHGLGSVTGGVIGAIGGSKVGAALVRMHRESKVEKEQWRVYVEVVDYGQRFIDAGARNTIGEMLQHPVRHALFAQLAVREMRRKSRSRPGYWLNPTYADVTLSETIKTAANAVAEAAASAHELQAFYDELFTAEDAAWAVGLMMHSTPELAASVAPQIRVPSQLTSALDSLDGARAKAGMRA